MRCIAPYCLEYIGYIRLEISPSWSLLLLGDRRSPSNSENYRHHVAADTPFLVSSTGSTSVFQLQITLAVCGTSAKAGHVAMIPYFVGSEWLFTEATVSYRQKFFFLFFDDDRQLDVR